MIRRNLLCQIRPRLPPSRPAPGHTRSLSFFSSDDLGPYDPTKLGEPAPRLNFNDFPADFKARLPDYASKTAAEQTAEAEMTSREPSVEIYSVKDVAKIRKACSVARKMVDLAGSMVEEGARTVDIESVVLEAMFKHECYPSVFNFHGFPSAISCSVNEIACHGLPDDRPLEIGDLVSIDVAVFKDGFHGDCSRTFLISPNDPEKVDQTNLNLPRDWELRRHLLTTAKECLYAGISTCGPQVPFRKVGHTIYSLAKRRRVTTLTSICGHGIGSSVHASPIIYHGLNNYPGVMEPGMVFTVGPCLSLGEGASSKVATLPVDPAQGSLVGKEAAPVSSRDFRPTAQFEHTVLITNYGVEVLTGGILGHS